MERGDKIILVTGATGHQGGAAARHLLEDGWRVRALTRDPNKAEAHSLSELGAEVVRADMLDRAAVDSAVDGVYGIYLMGTSMAGGPELEERMDRDVIESAQAAGVQHLVYSSTIGAGVPSDFSWVESKTHLENFIREQGLPATIWRPAYFMENTLRHKEEILAGRLTGPDWPETEHPMIAVDDIGRFCALAFREPERWIGETMTIAGDMLTFAEMADTLTNVLGIPVLYDRVEQADSVAPPHPPIGVRQFADIDVGECRKLVPGLASFGDWILATGWKTQVSASRGQGGVGA